MSFYVLIITDLIWFIPAYNNSKLKYKLYPVEVKSSSKYKTTSLIRFKDRFKERIGNSFVIHPKNLIVKDDIICIPAYMNFCL